jgi:hypothetical protein
MPAARESRLARHAWWIVLGLSVLAFGLRVHGLGFLLPQQVAIDEIVLAREVERIDSGREDFHRDHELGLYPDLLPRLVPKLSVVQAASSSDPLPLTKELARAAEPFFAVRFVVALLSVLSVPATYLLARSFLDAKGAMLAAALAATSFLDLWFAQQSRPHAAAGSLMLVAVLAALDLRQNPTPRRYVLAGIATGLAVGCLQYGIFVLPALLAAFWLRRSDGARSRWQDFGWLLVSLAIVAASIALFYQFVWQSDPGRDTEPFRMEASTLRVYGHRVHLENLGLHGLGTVLWTAWSYEPILSILALGACVLALVRRLFRFSLDGERRKDLFVVFAFTLPFLAVLSVYGATQQRFLIPLVPFAAVLAARLLTRIFDWLRAAFPVGALGAVVPATLVLLPIGGETWAAARLSCVRASDDTLTQAAQWIRAHARAVEDRVLLSPALDLPLYRRAAILGTEHGMTARSFPWAVYQREHVPVACLEQAFETVAVPLATDADRELLMRDPAGLVASLGVRFAVVEVRDGWGWPGLVQMRRGLQELGVLVCRFDPSDAGDARAQPFAYEFERLPDRVAWMWRTLFTRRTGPVIEIYELGR